MIPRKQLIKHNQTKEMFGDCMRTCVAILMDMEPVDVPHFCHPSVKDHEEAFREWLVILGYNVYTTMYGGDSTFEDILSTTGYYSPDVPMLLTGKSLRGVNHCVVIMNGKVFCDPFDGTANQEPFTGPAESDGQPFWWIKVITRGVTYVSE